MLFRKFAFAGLLLLAALPLFTATAFAGPMSTSEIQAKLDAAKDADWYCAECAGRKVEFSGDIVITHGTLFDGGDVRENMVLNGNITVEGDVSVHVQRCDVRGVVRGKNIKYLGSTVGGKKLKNDYEAPGV